MVLHYSKNKNTNIVSNPHNYSLQAAPPAVRLRCAQLQTGNDMTSKLKQSQFFSLETNDLVHVKTIQDAIVNELTLPEWYSVLNIYIKLNVKMSLFINADLELESAWVKCGHKRVRSVLVSITKDDQFDLIPDTGIGDYIQGNMSRNDPNLPGIIAQLNSKFSDFGLSYKKTTYPAPDDRTWISLHFK
jgi:hypothetical protein